MATKKKLLQAAAGSAGGAGLNVEEVFGTYVEQAGSGTSTVNQGIDLSGEGGMWWGRIRNISGAFDGRYEIHDTERGAGSYIRSDTTDGQVTGSYNFLSTFTSTGYTGWDGVSGYKVASWTFRKAPKFFDVVTYTGDGSDTREVSHNLGSKPGMIAIKSTSTSNNWVVWHRGATGSTGTVNGSLTEGAKVRNAILNLNTTGALASLDNSIKAPSSTTLYFGDRNNTTEDVNVSGRTYVAYLFAHNDGDGDFGPDGDADIVKCGSYTGNGSTDGPEIDLGFEPQWLLIKRTDSATPWVLIDNMRGLSVEGTGSSGRPSVQYLQPNDSAAELNNNYLAPKSTGFKLGDSASYVNASGGTYIYIAIRRGPMAVPESATEVFDVEVAGTSSSTPRTWNSGFPVDLSIYCHRDTYTSNKYVGTRLTGNSAYLVTNATSAESSSSNLVEFDHSDKIIENNLGSGSNKVNWMWRRAPNFFDVVAYTGNGTAGLTVSHNLGVAPEMIWVKDRDDAEDWSVYHAGITNPEQNYLYLNSSSALNPNSNTIRYWNHTAPTDSVFTLGDEGRVNQTGENYIAYLFASVDGVSKVGSYTGDGTTDGSKVIDCGFSSGARFVLIKRTDAGGSWYVWDSERGIVAGNDPRLKLESTDAEASFDNVDPHSSGFSVVGSSINNINGANYIFYAIA